MRESILTTMNMTSPALLTKLDTACIFLWILPPRGYIVETENPDSLALGPRITFHSLPKSDDIQHSTYAPSMDNYSPTIAVH
jgi:hypothetical protein